MSGGSGSRIERVRHAERLWPAPWLWVALVALAATAAITLEPAAGLAGVAVGGAVAGTGVAALAVWWSPTVRIVEVRRPDGSLEPWLQAGTSRIPVRALGEVAALRDGEWRAELGPALDARSHRVVRGWVGHGVRVAVTDPRDPVPYWLVSTRRPEDLAAAVTGARAGG
ncbi:MAG: DUF3093 domain-containing protein [Kineosporiaceae bacterium]